MEWRCFGVWRSSQSPRGIMGVNLPHTVLLQATESIIISRSRWRGFSTVFLSLLSDCTAGIWFDATRADGSNSRVPDNEWWNPREIRWKLQYTLKKAVWFIIYLWSDDGGDLAERRVWLCLCSLVSVEWKHSDKGLDEQVVHHQKMNGTPWMAGWSSLFSSFFDD